MRALGALLLAVLLWLPWAARGQPAVRDTAVVAEAFETPRDAWDNVDTPAVWHGPDGQHWLLSTAKSGDVIRVHDATTGAPLRRVGGSGSDLGEFDRPNGVAVIDDLMIVVERDNRRVQVVSLPSFEPLGAFGAPLDWHRAAGEGEDRLRLPYGLTVYESDNGTYILYVTDAFSEPDGSVPPPSALDQRVKQFRFTVENGTLRHQHVRNIGATSGPGRLKVVESIWADPAHDRLLIAEEKEGEAQIKVYTLDGTFTGTTISSEYFRHEAEGIMLYECGDTDGYWLTTDQSEESNAFHVFDRASLEHVGAFQGKTVTNTDGIFVTERAFGDFERGAVYAVHNDRSTVAVAWAAIAEALGLTRDCPVQSSAG
ncbi:phytase [Salinibacter altiplanensis]|uniref:phytase n=1 Tax=Salinibacter altiplanensis TaxID=1803181 RepID=UPI0018F8B139|nr:phytase [Salinibacter altiplanensis]